MRLPERKLYEKKFFFSSFFSLLFGEGNFSTLGGCNSGSGKFQLGNQEIRFYDGVLSTKACNLRKILLVEAEYFQTLHEVYTFQWFYEKEQLDLRGEKTLLSLKKRVDYNNYIKKDFVHLGKRTYSKKGYQTNA
jgi:heat shock protein HslJ